MTSFSNKSSKSKAGCDETSATSDNDQQQEFLLVGGVVIRTKLMEKGPGQSVLFTGGLNLVKQTPSLMMLQRKMIVK